MLIEIPWMPGVMLSIKARLSGKGVNLLVVPSDRRAETKAAFETLTSRGAAARAALAGGESGRARGLEHGRLRQCHGGVCAAGARLG